MYIFQGHNIPYFANIIYTMQARGAMYDKTRAENEVLTFLQDEEATLKQKCAIVPGVYHL